MYTYTTFYGQDKVAKVSYAVMILLNLLRRLFLHCIPMKPRNVIFVLVAVVIAFVLLVLRVRREPVEKELFNRNARTLRFTPLARCLMACNAISAADVRYIIDNGIINMNESDRYQVPCPVFALQGTLSTGKKIRTIFVQCGDTATMVNCMELGHRSVCDCQSKK